MQHKVKVTVLETKLYPELQARYCADPQAGPCPCYSAGDEFLFARYGSEDDFWHMGLDTLRRTGEAPATRAGGPKMPHCSEAWDAVSRYVYAGLQGGAIMRGWMADERVMITCCSDGTRPVIFKIERLDYKVVYCTDIGQTEVQAAVRQALEALEGVKEVVFRENFAEVFLEDGDIPDSEIRAAVYSCGQMVIGID